MPFSDLKYEFVRLFGQAAPDLPKKCNPNSLTLSASDRRETKQGNTVNGKNPIFSVVPYGLSRAGFMKTVTIGLYG